MFLSHTLMSLSPSLPCSLNIKKTERKKERKNCLNPLSVYLLESFVCENSEADLIFTLFVGEI